MSAANKVRIGAGVWRSRLLTFPDALGLRPTPDRVRQTLFNWLGQDLTGKRCLDLFAGSGALGFEALSRGARQVVMVEQNAAVHRALNDNARRLGAERLDLVRGDATQYLAQPGPAFDVIFLDPPFGQGWPDKLLPAVRARVAAGGHVYLEAERAFAPPAGWQLLKSGKAGNVHYHLLELQHGD